MSSRNKQKQVWSDELFVRKLEEIKAKRQLLGIPVRNTGDLTREIAMSDAWKKLEEELLKCDPLKKKTTGLRMEIKFDGLL